MKRIALTDGSGRWFDEEKAEKFYEDSRWNGNNYISIATGSQFAHEMLYHTASGSWVLHNWSQWQGTLSSYEQISEKEAARWLSVNNHVFKKLEKEIAALEI